MESTTIIKIQSLEPYRHLFPKALAIDRTVKKGAGVSDTVAFIPMVVKKTQYQVEKFVSQELQNLSTYAVCEKLWHFVKHHIAYKKDERGIEQVRSPRRLIHDGVGDCDCFTTFIGTCLSVLNIPVINRITKYKEDYFQHIYPIVPIGNGNYITMDCVVDKFNYEEPYTQKEDYKMDLQYLDGIENKKQPINVDTQDLFGWENGTKDLGKIFKRNSNTSAMPSENQGGQSKRKGFQKFKNVAKRTLNKVNKVNPATALLRAGILASMKLNVLKVAQKLKWGYLEANEAQKRGADMSKFNKLKNILYKTEQIFFAAGGKPENLKKAILEGKGNRNKEVNGLGLTNTYDNMSGINDYSNLPTLLGTGVYHDEFVSGLEGTEGLGVVATSTAIASATTVMATIAALLKSVGNLFPNKKAGNDFNDTASKNTEDTTTSESDSANDNQNSSSTETQNNSTSETKTQETASNETPSSNSSANNNSSNSSSSNSGENESSLPATKETNNEVNSTAESETENAGERSVANKGTATTETPSNNAPKKGFKEFWDSNKKWMKPLGIGLGAAAVLYLGYRAVKGSTQKTTTKKAQPSLNGMRKTKTKTKGKTKSTQGKKENIALM